MKFIIVIACAVATVHGLSMLPKPVCNVSNHEVLKPCGGNPCNSERCNQRKTGVCNRMCKPPTCECGTGYMRDVCTGKCVGNKAECSEGSKTNPTNCALTCTEPNQVWAPCGPDCTNNVSCEDRDRGLMCTAQCKPENAGCVCQPYFYRNPQNECVPSSQCRCTGENEYFDECGVHNLSCANRTQKSTSTSKCKPWNAACSCIPGLYRDANGSCVPESQCPPKCDPKTERYVPCGTCNKPSCADPEPKKLCPLICRVPGECVCIEGLLRDEITGKCVPPKWCSFPPFSSSDADESSYYY